MLQLDIVEDVADQFIKLALVGELDTQGQTQIAVRMTGLTVPFRRHAIVDLSGLTYISSMGIGLLLNINTGLKRQGKRLLLLSPPPLVAKVLSVVRLQKELQIVESEEQLQQLLADGTRSSA